jgi:hypothetical protein
MEFYCLMRAILVRSGHGLDRLRFLGILKTDTR